MSRNLDIGLLRAFAAAADQRSMTAAAEVLHLTQSAVSQQIARLESLAGGPLLIRDRAGLALTPAGTRLLGRVRDLLALNDGLWAEMSRGTVAGPVRLGVPFDLVGTLLVPALKGFSEACPEVELSLVCETSPSLARLVAAGRLDLALVEEPLGTATAECLAVERLVWVGARGGRAHAKRPLPVSLTAETCAFRSAVVAALRQEGVAWRPLFENASLETTLASVGTDLAVTACLAGTVPATLGILPPEAGLPMLPPFAVTLHRAGQPEAPAVAELVRTVREVLARPRQAA